MSDRSKLESELCQALTRQIEIYRSGIPFAQELAHDYDLSPKSQSQMEQLSHLMQEATELEISTQLLKVEWTSKYRGQSKVVRESSEELSRLIEKLIELTQKIETRALDSRNNLAPQLIQQLQIRKACSAYSNQ